MENLERLITRARFMLEAGMPAQWIRDKFASEGCREADAYWAVRGAQFEIDYFQEASYA